MGADHPVDAIVALVVRDAPAHARLAADALGALRVRVHFDGRPRDLGPGLELSPPTGEAQVEVWAAPAAVLDVLDGRTSLLTAIRAGGLDLRGELSALLVVDRVWRSLGHGLARAPASRALLSRLRAGWYDNARGGSDG